MSEGYNIKECVIHGAYVADACPRCEMQSMFSYKRCNTHEIAYHANDPIGCPTCEKEGLIAQKRLQASRKPFEPTLAYIPIKIKVKRKTYHTVNGLNFDSKTEAWRYVYLLALLEAGSISNLVIQPEYTLRPSYTLSGKWYTPLKSGQPRTISAEKYHPDFRYTWHTDSGNVTVIEEVKGLSKGKPYSKQASNFKQYTLQATIAHRDDMLFMIAAGRSNGSEWRYFQQSYSYPELDIEYTLPHAESEAA